MNAERLHAVAQALREELERLNLPAQLNQLVETLQQAVQQPQQAQHQQRVSELRGQLRESLSAAPSNDFSPAWRQHLEELEVDRLLGQALADQIEEIFSRNEITPAAAVEELAPLNDEVADLRLALERTTDGMSALGIGREELEPGSFEFGILIPRRAVDNELGKLGEEFLEVKSILLPLVELATGSRPGLEVRSISSSDFTAFLAAIPAAAALLTYALEKVLGIYKEILEIRTLRQGLMEQQVPDERLGPIKEYAEQRMEEGLAELAEELRSEFGEHLDEGRANELMTEVLRSLRALANRIDRGYNLEVRHEPLPPDSPEEGERGEEGGGPDYGRMVQERLPNIQFINLTGATILSLPEGEPPGNDGDQG